MAQLFSYKMHTYNVRNEAAICLETIILYVLLSDILKTNMKLRKSRFKYQT